MTESIKTSMGKKPDRIFIRKPGRRALRVPLNLIPKPSSPFSSTLLLGYGFAGLIILGAILLMFPFSSTSGNFTSPLIAFFTATSAVCVTGLVVVDTGTYWSTFGQAVIFCLFQIGGLGFIAGATVMLFAIGGKFGLRDRLLISESLGVNQLSGILGLVSRIAIFAFGVELIGVLVFYLHWSTTDTTGTTLWTAVFHAASAFNNCGLDILGNFKSLAQFNNDPVTLLITALLIAIGSSGYFVVADILKQRNFRKLALDSKIVLTTSLSLIVLGMLFYLGFEYNQSGTIGNLTLPDKFIATLFQAITTRTAGFSTFDIGSLSTITLLFTVFLMFIGGATSSTAGGIKVNTLGILVATVINMIRGNEHISVFGRQINRQTVFRAFTLASLYLFLAGIIITILSITENFPMEKLVFETFSAMSTVGLTTGITPDLSTIGKIVIMIAMFTGRLGPLTIMAYLVHHTQKVELDYPHENIKLG